jgi:hypothetical protein
MIRIRRPELKLIKDSADEPAYHKVPRFSLLDDSGFLFIGARDCIYKFNTSTGVYEITSQEKVIKSQYKTVINQMHK